MTPKYFEIRFGTACTASYPFAQQTKIVEANARGSDEATCSTVSLVSLSRDGFCRQGNEAFSFPSAGARACGHGHVVRCAGRIMYGAGVALCKMV